MSTPHQPNKSSHTREEPFQILYEVKSKCNEINQKIDSVLQLLQMLETYMHYSTLMRDLESGNVPKPESSEENSKGNSKGVDPMNPHDLQKLMSTFKNNDQPMSQEEFNTIFESLKQGKSKEEIARMDQMLQMAKSFMK